MTNTARPFDALQAAVSAFEDKNRFERDEAKRLRQHAFARELHHALGSAEDNANDTLAHRFEELGEAFEAEWQSIAMGSLACVLCDAHSASDRVRRWFTRHGVGF